MIRVALQVAGLFAFAALSLLHRDLDSQLRQIQLLVLVAMPLSLVVNWPRGRR